MNREQILEFFRDDDSLNTLNEYDRREIALACFSFSDKLTRLVELGWDILEEDD